MPKKKYYLFFILIYFFILVVSLTIFSFSQVDLNLTLSSNNLYLNFQKTLTSIGFLNRPLSTGIFVLLIFQLLFIYQFLIAYLEKNLVPNRFLIVIILLSSLLGVGYTCFSYDFFNYVFDARIITHYGLDPHFFKALDFPFDPWTRFMRWTHRYYPYGSGWLLISIIPSFLGFGKFLLTFYLFKLLFVFFHLANCYLVYKIGEKIYPDRKQLVLILYALNPLVLIESLLSPHNEVMMITFLLLSIFLLTVGKKSFGIISLLFSVSIKFLSGVFLPLLFVPHLGLKRIITIGTILWAFLLIPVIMMREFYPWYALPLIALLVFEDRKIAHWLLPAFSIALLSQYIPLIAKGEFEVGLLSVYKPVYALGAFLTAIVCQLFFTKIQKH